MECREMMKQKTVARNINMFSVDKASRCVLHDIVTS